MNLFGLLILAVFASDKKENVAGNGQKYEEGIGNNLIVVKIEEDEYDKVKKKSKFIGVSFYKITLKWSAQRRSKNENRTVYNGTFDNEETAAHASDNLARKLMETGEQNHTLNFPDDIQVYPEKKQFTSKFIGVYYDTNKSKWTAQRRTKPGNKTIYNGSYDNEETAAHASDTLAKKLIANAEQGHMLNFPDDLTEVFPEKRSSKFIGVTYHKKNLNWRAQRWSKHENKMFYNGGYDDEEETALASDNLARKLMENGEQNHRLNFPDDDIEVHRENRKKRKRQKDLSLENPQNK